MSTMNTEETFNKEKKIKQLEKVVRELETDYT